MAEMGEYRMPSLGADMRDGRVVEWFIQPGDEVHRGDVVGVVDTSKGAIEMEIWEDGVVKEIVVPPGDKVPVGEVLFRFEPVAEEPGADVREDTLPEEAGEVPREGSVAPTAEAPEGETAPATEPKAEDGGPPPEEAAPEQGHPEPGKFPAEEAPPKREERPTPDERVRASPAARRRAMELEIDLSGIEGSGPEGAIVLADVEARAGGPGARRWPEGEIHATPLARKAAEIHDVDLSRLSGTGPGGLITRGDVEGTAGEAEGPPEAKEAADASDRLAAMRSAIAAAMARSKREIPHYYLGTTVSALRMKEWLAEENSGRSPEDRILPVAALLKAVALAVRGFPELNGFWTDDGFEPADAVHTGLAISLRGGGLVAPAVHDADRRSLAELTTAVTDLVGRARVGRLRSSEVTDATLTVSSLGDRGVDTVYGVIYPPQVALVGFGRITERPWSEKGMLAVRPVVDITLSGDHRASDGHRGGLFLEKVEELLQKPEDL